MSERSNIPKKMVPIVNDIRGITEPFCEQYLNAGYLELSQKLLASLARKRPSPLLTGRAKSWAAGIIYCLGRVNFLFDKENEPYMSASTLSKNIGVSKGTASDYSRKIWNIFNMMQLDPKWTIPEMVESNPMVWMLSINGFMMDVRYESHDIQEEAFSKGLIPYVPYRKVLEDFISNIESTALGILPLNITTGVVDQDDIEFPEELPHNIADVCQKKPKEAISLLEKIIGKYKYHPKIYNYLAVAYSVLGDHEKVREVSLDNHRRNPDYLFAKLNLCSTYLEDDIEMVPKLLGEKLDLAELYPTREMFHTSECLSYYSIVIQYYLVKQDFGRVKTCFLIMYKISPEHESTKNVEEMVVRAYKKYKKHQKMLR